MRPSSWKEGGLIIAFVGCLVVFCGVGCQAQTDSLNTTTNVTTPSTSAPTTAATTQAPFVLESCQNEFLPYAYDGDHDTIAHEASASNSSAVTGGAAALHTVVLSLCNKTSAWAFGTTPCTLESYHLAVWQEKDCLGAFDSVQSSVKIGDDQTEFVLENSGSGATATLELWCDTTDPELVTKMRLEKVVTLHDTMQVSIRSHRFCPKGVYDPTQTAANPVAGNGPPTTPVPVVGGNGVTVVDEGDPGLGAGYVFLLVVLILVCVVGGAYVAFRKWQHSRGTAAQPPAESSDNSVTKRATDFFRGGRREDQTTAPGGRRGKAYATDEDMTVMVGDDGIDNEPALPSQARPPSS